MGSINKIMKNDHRIVGFEIQNAVNDLNTLRIKKNVKKTMENDDYKNRHYIRNKILEYFNNGLEKTEIIEKILNDDVMKKFEYLKKNGIDMNKCVAGWVDDAIRKNIDKEQQCR